MAITEQQIADSLTGSDNDYDEGIEGWLRMYAENGVIHGTFQAAADTPEEKRPLVAWHAVVKLGPAPAAP